MRFPLLLVLLAITACSPPVSRGDVRGQYTVCRCNGKERAPTPSEASALRDDERIDFYCEGEVNSCHAAKRPNERGSSGD